MKPREQITRKKKIGDITYTLEYDSFRENAFIRAERDDGKYMGTLDANEVYREPFMEVKGAFAKGGRGSRVGTRMYEIMAAFACERGRVLTSDTARTDDSDGFWNKQYRKGRAVHECVVSTFNRYSWMDCTPDKKKWDDEQVLTRYRLKPCPAPTNLEGMKRRRSRRRR